MSGWRVEPLGAGGGYCDCCGTETRRVWGWLFGPGSDRTAYYVTWTADDFRTHSARFDLVIGAWGDDGAASGRAWTSLEYRLLDSGPNFRVVDAVPRAGMSQTLAGTFLKRDDIIGQPLSDTVFARVDAVLALDDRAAELLDGWPIAVPM